MLQDWGFTEEFAAAFAASAVPGEIPGRVVAATRGHYRVVIETGTSTGESSSSDDEIDTTLTGRAAHQGVAVAVGDWVRLGADLRVQAVLTRRSVFSRRAAGTRPDEQLVAANVDVAVIVMGLDGDFNVRRLERYLTIAWEAGARPVVALSKADVAEDVAMKTHEAARAAPGVEVIAFSGLDATGAAPLMGVFRPRETAVLLGSSGVGKSTLANTLLGRAAQVTNGVREGDDRGRHTTTKRELFKLPSGALLLDTPGMRELQLWQGDVSDAFADIAELGAECRFADCQHGREPGCAVRAAVEDGRLEEARLTSFHALGRELAYMARQQDPRAQAEERRRWKVIHKAHRVRDRMA